MAIYSNYAQTPYILFGHNRRLTGSALLPFTSMATEIIYNAKTPILQYLATPGVRENKTLSMGRILFWHNYVCPWVVLASFQSLLMAVLPMCILANDASRISKRMGAHPQGDPVQPNHNIQPIKNQLCAGQYRKLCWE